MNAIELSGLYKQFTGKRLTKVDALKGIDLKVPVGEVFGFLGPNGAGKSTTIKLIMGLLKPTAGSTCIMDMDSNKAESRLNVGYLPENPAFYDYLSAEEYISFVGSQFKMDAELLRNRTTEVLQRLDLWEARKRQMRGYSKGMVQRVGLAQALVHDPDIYILDEPMSGLDPIGRALVKEIIRDLKQRGKTVFFSTHITADVEAVCDRVGVISNGVLEALDSVENIMEKGIEGYVIRYCRPDGPEEEKHVSHDELDATMRQLLESSAAIKAIEPKRKDMESFFLSVVSRS